jgi:VIT1/CCC1 family predicted Fe2+/Mn2+ transporter
VREMRELAVQPQAELRELAMIYVKRGLDEDLAKAAAEQLSSRDRIGSHLRDELGITPTALARPMQAAWISAASFALFALIPIAAFLGSPQHLRVPVVAAISLASLVALGAFGGHLGGAPLGRAALRVTLGGALAMAVTAVIGKPDGAEALSAKTNQMGDFIDACREQQGKDRRAAACERGFAGASFGSGGSKAGV